MVLLAARQQVFAWGDDEMKMVWMAATALAACMTPVAPAAAQDSEAMNVRYHDLDLASEHGVRKLNRRIAYASRLVCGQAANHSIREISAVVSCRQHAADRAQGALATAIASSRTSDGQRLAIAQALPSPVK
jgi:UrcA family protein